MRPEVLSYQKIFELFTKYESPLDIYKQLFYRDLMKVAILKLIDASYPKLAEGLGKLEKYLSNCFRKLSAQTTLATVQAIFYGCVQEGLHMISTEKLGAYV